MFKLFKQTIPASNNCLGTSTGNGHYCHAQQHAVETCPFESCRGPCTLQSLEAELQQHQQSSRLLERQPEHLSWHCSSRFPGGRASPTDLASVGATAENCRDAVLRNLWRAGLHRRTSRLLVRQLPQLSSDYWNAGAEEQH